VICYHQHIAHVQSETFSHLGEEERSYQ